MTTNDSLNDIAIIGMAGRYPGARNLDEFWQNLRDGVEGISTFTDDELIESGIDPETLADPDYVKAYGHLEGMEAFDAFLFGYTPREAQLMDPQHRLFLECAWEALEHAGYNPKTFEGPIGVYGGAGQNAYRLKNLSTNPDLLGSAGAIQTTLGNDKDFLTTRVSYQLDLRGPSLDVQTACSTSLVATHLACQSLLNGECDMALAGGASIVTTRKEGYFYQEGSTYSPDGHTRTFDARAKGMVGGDGVGIIVLKRLDDALEDGDTIYAVIKGTAINNDGSLKIGYTAPGIEGQARVIAEAQAVAGVDPETITYVEAHGTATPLGDPIEIAALTKAFRASTEAKGFCAIGSVKSNIGHTNAAAGVAGIIKTTLAMVHQQIPPSLHFETPNPEIDFANSPFYVNTKLSPWDPGPFGKLRAGPTPRRAGVSSFGMGGTNAHLILEEAPPQPPSGNSRPWQLIALSAKTSTALEAATENLINYLSNSPANMADVAYTLKVGRQNLKHRRVLACQDIEDAISALRAQDRERVFTAFDESSNRPVAFAFPGQGAQHVNMGLGLYQTEPTFRKHVDACTDFLKRSQIAPHFGFDLRDVLYPREADLETAAERLKQTAITQPALFTIEYALAQLWMSWGVQPQAMVGHSIGEYVAACLAGVFSLEEGLLLVATRGRMMQQLPKGSMLAIFLPEDEVREDRFQPPLLSEGLSLAAINEASVSVVSGPTSAIDELQIRLKKQDISSRRLHTSHAFHSAMMEPIISPFTEFVSQFRLQPPRIPFISNVTGNWITAGEATDPGYWASHLRQTVRFAQGVQELLIDPQRILLETGPGRTLTTLAKRHPARTPRHAIIPSMRHPRESDPDAAVLLNSVGQLWLSGVNIDWDRFYKYEQRRHVPLPTYPFKRRRHWIEPRQQREPAQKSLHKQADISDWFYVPSWKRTAPLLPFNLSNLSTKSNWLIFPDQAGLGGKLIGRLEESGQNVFTVTIGEQFSQIGEREFALDPKNPADYRELVQALQSQEAAPNHIIHLWGVDGAGSDASTNPGLEQTLDRGFYSLLFLAQALGDQTGSLPLQIAVVTSDMQDVTGVEKLHPAKATVIGPCRVIPVEYENISCLSIDVYSGELASGQATNLAAHLLAEIGALSSHPHSDSLIAYRGPYRWTQSFEPLRLPAPAASPAQLREKGVYLITGGLGGIGLALAEHLARTVQARLVLVGRSAVEAEVFLPAEEELPLEKLGAEVMVASADVANPEQMRNVVDQARERFGHIDGVIHAAGVAGGGVIELKTPETAAQVLAPKVQGTSVLDALFEPDESHPDEKPDFLVLCSSLASVLGGFGQVDYCAANAFLDAYAAHSRRLGRHVVSIYWDTWQEVGMAVNTPVPRELQAQRVDSLRKGIKNEEGTEVFNRVLHAIGRDRPALPQILVSTQDFLVRYEEQANVLTADTGLEEPPSQPEPLETRQPTGVAADESHPAPERPGITSEYVPPRNEIEQVIADVWQKLFGIEHIGVLDDFFQLGGHSLLATQILNKLRKDYQNADLSLRNLFEQPNIAGLATIIQQAYKAEEAKPIKARFSEGGPSERRHLVAEYLRAKIAHALNVDSRQITGTFSEGQIKEMTPALIWDLKRDFDLRIYPQELSKRPSLSRLLDFTVNELEKQAGVGTFESLSRPTPRDVQPSQLQAGALQETPPTQKNPSMVFLLSAPRSGSTLLRLMLAGHSSLFCPPELALLAFDSLAAWRENQQAFFAQNGVEHALMALMNLNIKGAGNHIEDLIRKNTPIREVYRLLQTKAGSRTLVDKTPGYAMNKQILMRAEAWFEQPKYVYLVRHPYTVIDSCVRNRIHVVLGEEDADPHLFAEEVWTGWNRNILEFLGTVPEERSHRVYYEELVKEPDESEDSSTVMRDLCEFLSIPFEDAVLNPYVGKRMIAGPGDPDIFQHDRINPELGEVWKKIRLPRTLLESTINLASEFNYELPQETSESTLADSQDLIANLAQLSDEEVDALLRKIMTEG